MSNNTLILRISLTEKEILQDFEDLGYGEIYDIELPKPGNNDTSSQVFDRTVSRKAYNFIQLLRHNGSFKRVVVHDEEPISAEAMGITRHKRKCLIKVKF